jgi:hypothetical protein
MRIIFITILSLFNFNHHWININLLNYDIHCKLTKSISGVEFLCESTVRISKENWSALKFSIELPILDYSEFELLSVY